MGNFSEQNWGESPERRQESVRRWVTQAEVDAGDRPGVTSAENEEIKRLKAENRRLREDVAILKAATSFFVGELDPRNR
ncbi:transposase [Serinicoccus sp. CUA-874]|nr:transposase [Serinicoccus sp. CUA-874]